MGIAHPPRMVTRIIATVSLTKQLYFFLIRFFNITHCIINFIQRVGNMSHRVLLITLAAIVACAAIVSAVTVYIFNTSFAHNTVDYFSFFAALFLIIDGFYKIIHYRSEPYFPNQFVRHIRIILGTCILTIHILQYVYGV